MNKKEIVIELKEKYFSFMACVHAMSELEYTFQYADKWSAAQQLEHIVLCVQPLVQVYEMNTLAIEQMFGRVVRTNNSYDEVVALYLQKLNQGGSAPESFLPKAQYSRDQMIYQLHESIENLQYAIAALDEEELESLQVPHPLLESISLKEMLYSAIYHVEHHHNAIVENLSHLK